MDYIWVNLKKSAHLFSNLCQFSPKCHLHSSTIILSFYVPVILQLKDTCPANVTPREFTKLNKIT